MTMTSHIRNRVRWRSICQQNADDVDVTLLSSLMQRRVTMLRFTVTHHSISSIRFISTAGSRPMVKTVV